MTSAGGNEGSIGGGGGGVGMLTEYLYDRIDDRSRDVTKIHALRKVGMSLYIVHLDNPLACASMMCFAYRRRIPKHLYIDSRGVDDAPT